MARRGRRKGVRYIEEDRDRSLTLSKRRDGLFKLANDLSLLTDASVAICLHDNNKAQFFGAPSVKPIFDAFVSEYPQAEPFADEQLKAKLTSMQSELVQLENEEEEKDKKTEESIQRFKKAQEESSGKAKHMFSRVEDLSHDDMRELLDVLLPLQQDFKQRLPPLRRDSKLQIGESSAWARRQPSCSCFLASHRPFTPLLPGGTSGVPMIPPPPVPGSPWSHIFPLQPSRFPSPELVPSQQLPPVSLPQNTVAPPPMHAPLVQQPLTNQSSAVPLLTQWQMRYGDQPPSEVQANTPVEQTQNDNAVHTPTFSDNFLSELLADVSDDGIATAEPLCSPPIDDQFLADIDWLADLDTIDGNL
uniref:MADS-box domain-containing protein n=1 Tax=Oryza punctata TaxID=4537 RepID=A0A0E0LGS7_ORYPU